MTVKPPDELHKESPQSPELAHRADILAIEAARLAGAPTYTQEEVDADVAALLSEYEV